MDTYAQCPCGSKGQGAMLERKIAMANAYLNRLYKESGKVYTTDIFRIVSPKMRDDGARILICRNLKRDKTAPYTDLEFVRIFKPEGIAHEQANAGAI